MVDAGLIRAESIELSPLDLAEGLRAGLVTASTVVQVACDAYAKNCTDPVIAELTYLLSDQLDEVPRILGLKTSSDESACPSANMRSIRKWLYLEMKAIYVSRDRRPHLWDDIADLYCDFDHPESIADLVPWMPLKPGQEAGEAAMMRRLEVFLREEHELLVHVRACND